MDAFKRTFIEKYFNGDINAYEKTMATNTPEADEAYLRYGKSSTINWRDLDCQLKSHSHYKDLSLAWVRYVLGYLPQQHAYLPSLAFLQTLTENYETSKLPMDQFAREVFFHVKNIRNEDMKKGGWVQHKTYNERDYRHYEHHLGLYKQDARSRLSQFLGYEPRLEYSLDAEIFLRQIFSSANFHPDMPFCAKDYTAGTVVKYRQVFIDKGVAAADASGLVSRTMDEFQAFLHELENDNDGKSKLYDLNLLN